jgi:hypothetical protein
MINEGLFKENRFKKKYIPVEAAISFNIAIIKNPLLNGKNRLKRLYGESTADWSLAKNGIPPNSYGFHKGKLPMRIC